MENFPHLPTLISVALAALVLIAILDRWLFRPLNAILDERRERVEGARAELEQARETHEERLAEIEAQLADARREAYSIREDAQRRGRQRRDELLQEARQEARQELDSAKQEIAAEVASAKESLEDEASRVAEQIAGRLLESPAGSAGDGR